MKTLRENEGYDVPWEFIKRRSGKGGGELDESPTGTTNIVSSSSNGGHNLTTVAGGSHNENDIHFERLAINKKTTNGCYSKNGDNDSSSSLNGGQNFNKKDDERSRNLKKTPPLVAPKPTNGIPSSSTMIETTTCIFNKMPGDSSSMNSVIINTPPCGIRAQRIRKERHASGNNTNNRTTATGTVSTTNSTSIKNETDELDSCIVWEYRKPEQDFRPSCEYDAPWDQKNRLSSSGQHQSCLCPTNGAAVAANGPTSMVTHQNGDAIYDEPWDTGKNIDTVKTILGFRPQPGKRDSYGLGSNNSPSTTSRSSDSRGSAATTTSNESDENKKQYPDTISIRSSIGSTLTEHRNVEKKVNGSVRLETVFCSKSSPLTTMTRGSIRRYQDKDKLIQQLCSGGSMTPPAPARRSLAKKIDGRNSMDSMQIRERRSLDSEPPRVTLAMTTTTTENGENGAMVKSLEIKDDDDRTPLPDYDTPWEFTNSMETTKVVKDLQNAQQQVQSSQSTHSKKSEPKSKLNRQHLSLNFGCAALNPSSAKIDVAMPLNEQLWYHGNITRAEAEQRLSKAVEGSFLVRVCESSTRQGEEYALSLKSAKGFMHMKIQQDAQRSWILGYFSQPFESVPIMIRYYSLNKLPIKGAEHMRLLRPVADQVL